MKKAMWILGAMLVAGSLATAARAQPPSERRSEQRDVVEHEFSDADDVHGDRHGAWGDRLHTRIRADRRTLIRPRWSFSRELRKSLEDL